MAKILSSYLNTLAQRTIYGVILVTTIVAAAVAQPPVNAPGPGVAPLPPGLPPDFNPAREQPAPVGQAETLETAWAVALSRPRDRSEQLERRSRRKWLERGPRRAHAVALCGCPILCD